MKKSGKLKINLGGTGLKMGFTVLASHFYDTISIEFFRYVLENLFTLLRNLIWNMSRRLNIFLLIASAINVNYECLLSTAQI